MCCNPRPSKRNNHGSGGSQKATKAGHAAFTESATSSKNEQRVVWQQHRASSWQTEHRTWLQRGGYIRYRIPEDHFTATLAGTTGSASTTSLWRIFGGHPRFQYEGYCSVLSTRGRNTGRPTGTKTMMCISTMSGGGYYMYNRRHPRDRIAITVYVS